MINVKAGNVLREGIASPAGRREFHKQSVPCPVCESTRHTVLYSPWVDVSDPAKLYGAASGITGTQTLVRCSDCGMIYENPRYSADLIAQGYMSSDDAGHDSQHPMRVLSFFRTLNKLKRLLPPPGSRVLDVGTAGGAFLEAAQQFGYDAYGMEPSRYLVDKGKARGLKIEQGMIDNHTFEPHSFDMVSLWDVIEHIAEPKAALTEMRKLLKPDGILLINYPDIGTWSAKLAGKRFWWILSVHLHHFTRRSIADICQRTGFEAFHFQRYWQTLEFGYLERMAIHYKIPLAALLTKLTPGAIQRIPLSYYASQTTTLARIAP
jgi:2-polyprenyl-3-methyl-5-hydroxy-6-metoxy-1,4-benzoquinol methylase